MNSHRLKIKKAMMLLAILSWMLPSCSATNVNLQSTPATPTKRSYFTLWEQYLDRTETKWQAQKITSYEISGTAMWAWHGHSFRVKVIENQIVASECTLEYDSMDEDWCTNSFKASEYIVPGLFDQIQHLIAWNRQEASDEDCFQATFDHNTGVPLNIKFDCPTWYDEDEKFEIKFKVLGSTSN